MRIKRASRAAIIVAGAAMLSLGGMSTAFAAEQAPAPAPAPVEGAPAVPLPPCGIPSGDPNGSVPPGIPSGAPTVPAPVEAADQGHELPTVPCWGPAPGVPVPSPAPGVPVPAPAPGVPANG